MMHPFVWLQPGTQRNVFIVLLLLTLTVASALQWLDRPLKEAGAGIVKFELAGSLAESQAIVRAWGVSGRVYAGLSLGLDYLYLVLYPLSTGLACVLVAGQPDGAGRLVYTTGIVLAWALLGAGVLDALENFALIRLLLGAEYAGWPVIARWCALVKFVIVGFGLLYLPVGLLLRRALA